MRIRLLADAACGRNGKVEDQHTTINRRPVDFECFHLDLNDFEFAEIEL